MIICNITSTIQIDIQKERSIIFKYSAVSETIKTSACIRTIINVKNLPCPDMKSKSTKTVINMFTNQANYPQPPLT